MELNLKVFEQEILEKRFNNNQRKCANALGVSPEFLNKILKRSTTAGALFLGKLKKYCDANHLNFDIFIFLQ